MINFLKSKWAVLTLGFLFLAGFSVYLFVERPHRGYGQPALEIIDTHRSVGNLLPDAQLLITFRLRNAGGGDLLVDNLKSTCGCSPATIDKGRLHPGDSATIAVDFHAPREVGPFAHSVRFHTNDPDRISAAVVFNGRATWPIEVEPTKLHFYAKDHADPTPSVLELFTSDASPIDVRSVRPDEPWIRVEELVDHSMPHRKRYRVGVDAGSDPGTASGTIRFDTGHEKRPIIVVPILREAVTSSSVTPRRLMLKPIEPGGRTRVTFLVRDDEGREIDDVRAVQSGWTVTGWILKGTADRLRTCEVEIQVPEVPGYSRTKVRFFRGNPDRYDEVDVSGLVGR